MHLAIFARTFPRRTFAETLDAVGAVGLRSIQFNFSCVGLATLPERIEPGIIAQIRRDCAGGTSSATPLLSDRPGTRGDRLSITISGVSGTFNMIDPDAFIFGGGLSNVPELYDRLPGKIRPYVFSDSWAATLAPAKWGDSSGVRGAAQLWQQGR